MKKLMMILTLFSLGFAGSGNLAGEKAGFVGSNQLLEGLQGAWRASESNLYATDGGELWLSLQGNGVFAMATLTLLGLVVAAFALHYFIVGAKHFDHGGKKVLAFGFFTRLIHATAALSWVVLVPTGIVMMCGEFFGGGAFVRFCKNAHIVANFAFCAAVLPMILVFLKRMLPRLYDIKWLLICGGYLTKEKRPIPAGKFNAGQKMWFVVAGFGGLAMIVSGLAMLFLNCDISTLRTLAIVHNIGAAVCVVMFCVHLYMVLFAVKGSLSAMIDGYKTEDEVFHLHNEWHKELKQKGVF